MCNLAFLVRVADYTISIVNICFFLQFLCDLIDFLLFSVMIYKIDRMGLSIRQLFHVLSSSGNLQFFCNFLRVLLSLKLS